MLAGLCHYSIVAGHHHQRMVDAANACQHISEEFFMAGNVDKPQHAAIWLRPIGITKIDGHATALFLRQAIGIDAGDRL